MILQSGDVQEMGTNQGGFTEEFSVPAVAGTVANSIRVAGQLVGRAVIGIGRHGRHGDTGFFHAWWLVEIYLVVVVANFW